MLSEFLIGTGIVLLYFVVVAVSAVLLRKFVCVPDEVFRKLLHCILCRSLVA